MSDAGAIKTFWGRYRTGYLFAGPYLLGLAILVVGPLLFSGVMSLTDWDGVGGLGGMEFVGLDNYRHAFSDDLQATFFKKSLVNTLIYAALSVPLGLAAGLGLALLLNRRLPGLGLFRTVFYLPHVVAGVATVMMWQWVFHPELGLLNSALRGLGVDIGAHPVLGWLQSPAGAKPALILMSLWGCGGAMLIFLAALQNVPEHLYEAARVDGAGRWRQFWHVTLPQISPALLFNLIMGTIGALQIFTAPFLLYSRRQDNALLMVVMQIYYEAFNFGRFGYASALAWILLGIILVLTLLLLWTSRHWVYYEAQAAPGGSAWPWARALEPLRRLVRGLWAPLRRRLAALGDRLADRWDRLRLALRRPHRPARPVNPRLARLARRGSGVLAWAVLAGLSAIFLMPFIWSLSASLKPLGGVYAFPPELGVADPQWQNYPAALAKLPFGRFVLNTLIIALASVAGQLLTGSMAGYAFARLRWPGRDLCFGLLLAGMMLPAGLLVLPQFLIFGALDWVNTYKPLIVPSWLGGAAFFVFLFRQFFRAIPVELEEAARLDGASEWGLYWRVFLPLSKPVLITVGLMSFVAHWQEFMAPLIYLSDFRRYPVSLGLRMYQSMEGGTYVNLLMAASVVATVPLIVLFLIGQRYFTRSLLLTGSKG